MVRRLVKKIIQFTEWILYKVLDSEQKRKLSNLLTQKQKDFIKKLLRTGHKQSQLRTMDRVRYRLYNLGFIERGLEELWELYQQKQDSYLRKLAGWELVLWYANQYTEEGARQCLDLIPALVQGEKDAAYLRKAAIMEAECLARIGNVEQAQHVVNRALESSTHVDLYLAKANLESSTPEKIKWMNQALEVDEITPISIDSSTDRSLYDSIMAAGNNPCDSSKAKVTVIMPVYNAEDVIHTSLGSVLNQTWINLEVLVVDDCSSDATADVVQQYAKEDQRVQLIQAASNGGAYVARNLALKQATGDFVTVNDADDWSHPQKIEKQVLHLLDKPSVMGNTSQQARATEELIFYRRGKLGTYTFGNMSSFMFRRIPVMEALGYWDSVRFGADGEFVRRMKKVFGEKSVVELPTGLLSFQRQSSDSLTGNKAFGFPGFFMGARKEYLDSHEHYHETAKNLRYEFPQNPRPFPVPEPMWPKREEKPSGRRHFDVIIASEFRLQGGTNMSNIEEIKAQKEMGLRTGLIQMSRYDLKAHREMNPQVRELIDGDQVQMLVYGEKVSCDVLIVRHPPVLQEWQKYIPDVEAKAVNVIVNQPPKKEYSAEGIQLYDLERCRRHLERYFGQPGTWYPIGPLVRESLHEHHAEELPSIDLADEDWVNIINVEEWRRPHRPALHSKVRIGRHSRPQYVKWPADPEQLLMIYPDSEPYEVHVLGGADIPNDVLGHIPANWHVRPFGDIHPKDFLAELDVYVYYTHPEWVEAFGRVIFEAMAVGVPVIIPPDYRELFGEAAIYAEPEDVQEKIDQLMTDDKWYESQVNKAQMYVEEHFGYSKHASRLGEFGVGKQRAQIQH